MDHTDLLEPQSQEAALAHGLSTSEFAHLTGVLGRMPNLVELGVVSAMWSEHCSYKSSRHLLAEFPTTGEVVLQGPGENAGAVDIGDGLAAVFKMESHNHPSMIEPHQGAATGVGGILRDIFTMGARPVAILDALRFGAADHERTSGLLTGVVSGIASYGNCVGVPTVGGETGFDAGYNDNILVNVMAVGVASRLFYARGARPSLPVMYVGAATGRDGIHGASMSSSQFSSTAESRRPTVQVGDPFMEKMLIEACLELMATDAIVAIQDMGAAGLTSSAVEMAHKASAGIEMNLDAIPVRESRMNAYEIMLSESQERMLMVVHPDKEHLARSIFAKWELEACTIGRMTDDGRLRLTHHGAEVCHLPVAPLADPPPGPSVPALPVSVSAANEPVGSALGSGPALSEVLVSLMSSPQMCCKDWIGEQYDRHVMNDTIEIGGIIHDSAIVRVHGTPKALALTSDCTPRYVARNAYTGAMQAVAESYRNLCAAGARPMAITNNLNFGAPTSPTVATDLVRAVTGIADAARALDFPVVSGNVSLNNQTDRRSIPPTPVIGGLGLIPDIAALAYLGAPRSGDHLAVLGHTSGHMQCSLYAQLIHDNSSGIPPGVDLTAEIAHGRLVRRIVSDHLVRTVHDVSDGGIACAAAEMALAADIGVSINSGDTDFLFAEDQARYLMAISREHIEAVRALVRDAPFDVIGVFGGSDVQLGEHSVTVAGLGRVYRETLPYIARGCHTLWSPDLSARS